MNELRNTILAEEQKIASKQRFGLFSQPPPLAIGDDGEFVNKKMMRGADGKPKTQARNLFGGLNRSGQGKKAFIEAPGSTLINDPYLDPYKINLLSEKVLYSRAKAHEYTFKPASGTIALTRASYDYLPSTPLQHKKQYRNTDGKVRTKPKNINSNPNSKIQTQYFKKPPHQKDEYERKEEKLAQDRRLSKQKMPETMFKSVSHTGFTFSKLKDTFGFDGKSTQMRNKWKSSFGQTQAKSVNHQARFKPARRGHGDALGRYPEFIMPQNVDNVVSKAIANKLKEAWKPSGESKWSRPTPSLMQLNLKRSMSVCNAF